MAQLRAPVGDGEVLVIEVENVVARVGLGISKIAPVIVSAIAARPSGKRGDRKNGGRKATKARTARKWSWW
jgi:hypothetical protein